VLGPLGAARIGRMLRRARECPVAGFVVARTRDGWTVTRLVVKGGADSALDPVSR
jgi:hypothetical protein